MQFGVLLEQLIHCSLALLHNRDLDRSILKNSMGKCLVLFWLRLLHGEAEFCCNERSGLAIDPLVHGGKNPATNQWIDDVCRIHLQQRCKVTDRD